MRAFRIGIAATVIAALGVLNVTPADAAFTKQEEKCAKTLVKGFSKLQSSILKAKARCHDDDISGKLDSPDACATLDPEVQAKLDSAKTKYLAKLEKDCVSTCNVSEDLPCVVNDSCPALHPPTPVASNAAETCVTFSLTRLDFPGPYCEQVLGRPLRSNGDLGECVTGLMDIVVDGVDEAIYADFSEASGLSDDAAKCLSSIGKSAIKGITKAYAKTAECRNLRQSENDANNLPFACALEEPKSVGALTKALDGISGAVEKSCDGDAIAELDGLCATGGLNPSGVAGAQACLTRLVREVSVGERNYDRVFTTLGMIAITNPSAAQSYCGDGFVDTAREESTGVGEECDGDNDAACGAGSCYPPGDTFECTCDTTARERFIVNGDEDKTDSDAGWNGQSHDATHNDGFGYVNELSNCTCDSFNEATCTTPSGDDVCDLNSNMAPRCSNDLDGPDTCDDKGDGNGLPENPDCWACDDESLNPGTYCAYEPASGTFRANHNACQSQCIVDATGLPTMPATPCTNQTGCGAGETCRGRCDDGLTCNLMTEGSPLPLISAEIAVCIRLEYLTDITGSKNMVTGETELNYTTRSLIALGDTYAHPCPLCQGLCIGGSNEGDACMGRCDVSGDECLYDSDCTAPGDTACLESDDDCPGSACSLDIRCSGGTNAGRLCEPATRTVFGVVSHQCPATPAAAEVSGTGVIQPFGTVTTEAVQHPVGSPCTDSSWINYDCPCPANTPPNTGVPTKPNGCAAACDGGVNEGKGCAIGGGSLGDYTSCVGGGDAGKPCDADADCDSNNCSAHTDECTAGPTSELGTPCTQNTDCGMGGLCEDPCPGARCVPLCMQEGRCNGGARDGDLCATAEHCKQCSAGNPLLIGTACDMHSRCDSTTNSGDGFCEAMVGVTCDLFDAEEGLCAGGPTNFRCNGPGFGSVPCELSYGQCTNSVCTVGSPSKFNLPCVVASDCLENPNVPVSSGCETGIDARPGTNDDVPGAGECEPRPWDCYVNNGFAEGGDTLNGQGSPTNVNINAAFCTPANGTPIVNDTSGFGGPSRIRRQGVAVVNVPSIP
jgi:hypothetical protein